MFFTQNENKKTNVFFIRRGFFLFFGVFQQKEFFVEAIKSMKFF